MFHLKSCTVRFDDWRPIGLEQDEHSKFNRLFSDVWTSLAMYRGQSLWSPESFNSSTSESKPLTRLKFNGLAWISLIVQKDFNVGHLYRRPCHKAELSTETGLLLDVQEYHTAGGQFKERIFPACIEVKENIPGDLNSHSQKVACG